eukprot:3496478-Prymnesium_polylepis.1
MARIWLDIPKIPYRTELFVYVTSGPFECQGFSIRQVHVPYGFNVKKEDGKGEKEKKKAPSAASQSRSRAGLGPRRASSDTSSTNEQATIRRLE